MTVGTNGFKDRVEGKLFELGVGVSGGIREGSG
jgi:hypothetical protein